MENNYDFLLFRRRYLTVLCFGSVVSVDGSDTILVFVGLGDENKSANHPRSLSLSDAPLQHTAQILYFIFVK